MPLAWEVVAVQFGYIGLRLWERFGKAGLVIIGILGAINIPFYEEMARRIHWWQYSACRMISFTLGTLFSANLASHSCWHYLREHCGAVPGTWRLSAVSLAEYRFLLATRQR